MKNTYLLNIQEELAEKYKYKKLSDEDSKKYRELYQKNLPKYLNIDGNANLPIYTNDGTLICDGYERIVIGDYGAFIEFSEDQANKNVFKVEEGQEWRFLPKYTHCKYHWLTINDSDIKIYHQINTVTYADYKVGMYYISPHEDIIFGYEINSKLPSAATITLSIPVVPNNCGECPFYITNTHNYDDEEYWFGDGTYNECLFGGCTFGCLVERPKNCPLVIKGKHKKIDDN